jgi:5-(carboxyamino)imidazole ribonucleotide synthase
MKVAVLGNGQLGQMLELAGRRIGIAVQLLDVDGGASAGAGLLPPDDVPITAEREHWPDNRLTAAVQAHPLWCNQRAFSALSNRIAQKSFLDALGVATAPWCELSPGRHQNDLHQMLGPDVFLKRASGGYDGRGQQRLKAGSAVAMPDWYGQAIAEQAIGFDTEVSLIGARSRNGSAVFYRLTENRHENGVLTVSVSMPGRFSSLQAQAQQMLGTVMDALDYVGVMAMECFVVGDKLLVNEIAPRVHNSGHWTQAGAAISQFELHLRAVCDLPLPQPEESGCSVMINLLGLPFNADWMKHGAAQVSWYGKQLQPGRKMGHLNFNHAAPLKLAAWIDDLALPIQYAAARQWVLARVSTPAQA